MFFNASVAELRRKAQEHSEALLKNIQSQQHKNGEASSPKSVMDKKLLNDSLQSMPDVGIFNGKILPKSTLNLGKSLNGPLTQPESLSGPSLDFPKFPPPNYLSALSNFGLHGFPTLPDFNSSTSGFHPKFASNLANLIDKSSDTNVKNSNNEAEIVSVENKTMSPGRDEIARSGSSDNKLQYNIPSGNPNKDGSKLDA